MRALPLLTALGAATLTFSAPAAAVETILNFDAIGAAGTVTSPGVIRFSNYGGFNWQGGIGPESGWVAVDLDVNCPDCGVNGLRYGRTSGQYAATQLYGHMSSITSPSLFRMVSVQLSSAHRDGMTVRFSGLLSGSQLWTQDVIVNRNAPTLVQFDSRMINQLRVASFGGGTPQGGGSTAGAVFDDFRFNTSALAAVPEPATWAFMILGFGAIGGAIRRRKHRIHVNAA